MNYPSNQVRHYRIFVRGFDDKTSQYEFARIERVAFPPLGFPTRMAFDSRMRENVEITLFAMDFDTYEVVPLFLVPNKAISSCLFHVRLVIDQFEK